MRSPHAHARVVDVDVSRALEVDGLVAIYTYEDLEGPVAEPLPLLIPHPRLHAGRTAYPLANGVVRHVGEPVAMVVARDRYLAEDACERIAVAYEPLAPVVGLDAAVAAERTVHDDVPDNVAARMVQEHGDARAAVAAAPHRLELDLDIERSASMPMEGRGVYARWDAADRSLRVYSSTQTSTSVRFALAVKLGVPVDRVEVIAPDVGGGFGVKIVHPWPEEVLVPWAAIRLGREVKWAEDRREHFVAAAHERGPAPPRQRRLRRRRPPARPGRRVPPRQRRLHPLRDHRPDHHRDPAPRPLQAGRLPGRVPLAVHQHRDRHPLPGRRPAPGGVRDGADHGRHRRLPGPRPGRGPRGQLHPALRDAL